MTDINESTPYYNKPSFLKRMGRAAKQERLAREKKEKEAGDKKKVEEGLKPEHNMRPGWMLRADPELSKKVDANKKKFKEFKKLVGSKPEKTNEEVELDEAVVAFPKKKTDAPREINKDDVENAWALKHVAAKDDKISYQHNGVTLHHANGDHTFILGGHKPLFDREPSGKLKFKDDLSAARRAFKMPTQKAKSGNVVSLKKEEVELEEGADPQVHVYSGKKHLGTMKLSAANKEHGTNISNRDVGMGSHGIDTRVGSSSRLAHHPDPKAREVRYVHASHAIKEEVQLDEARINGREYASQGLMHPDHAKMDIHQVSGHHVDFYASKTGDKMQGKVVKNDGKQVHIQAHKDKELGDGKLHKFKVQGHLNQVHEELQGNQHKLDANKNGKLDKMDFAKLRARRKKLEEAKKGLEDACWKGYTAVGMKDKNGKKVPNCVPVKEEALDEKIDMKKASMGDVIKDFKKSDAPQFKGKSAEKRREMAIAAKLSNEETQMSEQEQLDELSKKTLGSYVKKAANDKADTAFHRGYSAYNNSDHKPYSEPMANKVHAGQENRNKGIKRAVARLTKEEHTMSFKAFLEEGLAEGVWPGTPEYKAKFPDTSRGKVGDKKVGAKGTQTVTSTGVKHERNYDDSEKDDAPETTEKRGRGRPKGSASGARQKGSAPKSKDGVDYTGYPLHLPGRH